MTATAEIDAPRLREDLVIVPQQQAGRPYFVVQDGASGRVFGFNAPSMRLLRALDGRTTIDELVSRVSRAGADPAELRRDVVALISRARDAGLLEGDAAEAARPEAWWRRFNIFYIRLGVRDPTPAFRRLAPALFPLFSGTAAAILGVALAAAIVLLARSPARLWGAFATFGFFKYWLVAYALLFVSTLWHETGHAMACMRWGGRVRSMGFLLYLFQPAFYTNVTDTWLFPSRWRRIVVSLGGVYFESFLLCAAVFTWAFSRPFSVAGQVAFVFAVISASRIVLNLVPFLRLDGYFVLMDLLDMKNLRPRAFAAVLGLLPRVGRRFRARVRASRREQVILVAYGLVALGFVAFAIVQSARLLRLGIDRWQGGGGAWIFWLLVALLVVPSILSIARMMRGLEARR